jgi:hypothetical protein
MKKGTCTGLFVPAAEQYVYINCRIFFVDPNFWAFAYSQAIALFADDYNDDDDGEDVWDRENA